MFNVQKLLNNKLGIYVDTVKTNALADIGSSTRSMTMQERQIIQNGVERVYATFIGRVAEGRKKSTADIDSIGQGRVWSGSDAKDLGLVDELGGLNDAINYAAKKANIDKYRILELPKSKNLVEQIFNNVDDETETRILKTHLGNTYPYYMKFNHVLNMRGIQARMEYDVDIY
jgi:protease-4